MKLFGAIFWAVILIVIGLIIILNQVFDWKISVFAVVMGILLIFLGIGLITKPATTGINGVFAHGKIELSATKDNSYVFSNVTLNLNDIDNDKIEVNSIFSTVIIHTEGKSVNIKSSGVFSKTEFPDKTSLNFGERRYERDGDNTINIETNCVFGSIIID